MAIRIQTVTTEAFAMDYFCFGHGARTLIILPGISVQSVMGLADAVAEAYRSLADDCTVYVFDRRRNMPAAYSIHDMARDTARAIAALGLSPVDLFGTSQGGMIALCMAMEHPERVRRLALGSTTARVDAAHYQIIEKWIQLAKRRDATGLYLAFGEAVYPQDVFEASRAPLSEAARTVTEAELERFIIQAKAMKGFDVMDDLAKIACPVLVIGSSDDHVLGGDASERIAERLNGRAELYMYDGYGHAAYDTAPDYKARILRFLIEGADG